VEIAARFRQGANELGLVITPECERRLLGFLEELQRWGKRINLTAIRDPREGVEKHLLDALLLVPLLRGDERLLDIGSGAGLPGIPLKIVLPKLQLISVEAAEKKVLFQRHALRLLGLEARVEHVRVEALGERDGFRHAFEVITARAFSSLDQLVAYGAPLLAPHGRIIAMKGPEGAREWREARVAREGWCCTRLERVTLPFSGAQRQLLEIRKGEPDPTSGGC